MAMQSFADFVGRGQQNLYQGSAPTATVLPQQEIQRLLAELRRGGARAQNAMRILQSTPEGRQAIQPVSAPAPAPVPARPQTAQPVVTPTPSDWDVAMGKITESQRSQTSPDIMAEWQQSGAEREQYGGIPEGDDYQNFINHELLEKSLVERGMSPEDAHTHATEQFGEGIDIQALARADELKELFGADFDVDRFSRDHLFRQQMVDTLSPAPAPSLSGTFFNYNPLGQAIRGLGRAHAPAGKQALDILSGMERFAQAEILDLGYIPPPLRDYVRENVKPLGVDLQEYEAAKEAQREIDRADPDRSLGAFFNPFISTSTRVLSDPKWSQEATQLPVHLPFINEGRSPAFHISALDLAGAVADPSIIVGAGPTKSVIAKQLRQAVPYLETLQKSGRRTPVQVLQEGGQSLVEEFAPVTRKVEEAARATGSEVLRQAERMPGGIPGVSRFADEPIIPPRQRPRLEEIRTKVTERPDTGSPGDKIINDAGERVYPASPGDNVGFRNDKTGEILSYEEALIATAKESPSGPDLQKVASIVGIVGGDAKGNFIRPDRAVNWLRMNGWREASGIPYYEAQPLVTPKTKVTPATTALQPDALGSGFELPSDLARSRVTPKFGWDAPPKNIVFESNFDRALYLATAKGTPKSASARANRETIKGLVREELEAVGLDPNKMDEIAAPMRQAVQDAAQATNKYDVEFEIFNYADEAALGRPRTSLDLSPEAYLKDPDILTDAAPTAAARGAVDLSEKLPLDPTIKAPDVYSPQGVVQQGEEIPRYWYHRPPSHVPVPKDGGLNAYILKEQEAKEIFGDVNVKGIWLSPTKDYGESSVLVDLTKLDNSNMLIEASGLVHRGNIPKSALVDPPTTQVTRQAAGEPKLSIGLKRSSPRWKGKTIEWDSDVDKALYIVANPTTRSKAHDKFMDFLRKDVGLSDQEIRILGPTVRDSVTRLAQAEPGNVLRVPALRQGAPVRQPTATAREVAEEGADVGDETYIAIQQRKEARAASAGKTREEQIALANRQRTNDSIGHTLAGGVSLKNLPPIEESLSAAVTPRQLDMFSDPSASRLVDDPVEAQVTARGAAQPVDTAKAADVAPDVAEGIPPIPPIILKEGPFSVPIGDSGRGLEALQDAGTQLEVAFQANTFRKIGEKLSPISRFFDPSLASPESSIGKRLVIVLANLMEEGRLKADRAFTYVQRLGSRQSIFGRIDNQNKFVDGPFAGRTLNEVAENRNKPIVKRLLQSIKLNEVDPKTGRQLTAEDYVIRLQQLDEAASELARKYGAEIGFSPTDEVLFATREIYGKINSEGKVIKVAFPSHAARGKAKTALEHMRLFPTAREATDAGYVLLPYDDVVKVKLQQAYRVGAEEEVAQYVLKNFEFEKVSKPNLEQQQSMFRGVVGTSEDAKKLARDYEEAAQSFTSESKVRLSLLEAANDLGRTFELAGDASIFTIQLFFTLIRDMLLPVYGIRSPGRTARVPGSLFAGSAKEFARTFVIGLRDPERAKALNAKVIDEAREELTGTRIAIFSMPGESPELTRGVGRLADLQEFFEGKVSRIPGAVPALRGATFPIRRIAAAGQEGYIAVQNMAGIYLYRALRETARKADGTLDPKLLNDVEDNINVMRGITSTERLGVSATQRSIENMALLAPRYRKAVLSMYKNVLQGGLRGQLAREQFLTGIAGMHLAGLGIVWAKGKAEGKSDKRIWHEIRETLIPGGESYFVTQAGDAMVGFGGKTISDIRFVANLLRAGTDPEAVSRTIQNWIRGQISFVGQDFWTIGTGRGYMGEAVTPWARKQIGQDEGGYLPVEEWGPGFGKWAASHGAFIWLQSMALDGGSASSRTTKGSSEFIGGRGFERGKKQLLEDASWDRFEKPYSDLNLLERDTLKRDPEIGPQLLDYDLHQAKKGNKYAGYNVTKAAQKEKKERLNQTALDVLVQDMNDKSKVHAGNKMGGGVRDILKEFSDTVRENQREEFYANKGHRSKYGMTGYTGKEPTNDFDRMLNDWYALYDKNTKGTQQLDWDSLEKDQKAFIANLSPELAGQLQEWRDRESGVPGVEELKELLGPKKDEQGNEIVHPDTKTYASGRVVKNKQAGEPVFYNNIELAIEIWNVILASEQGEAGYTEPEMSRVLERDYGVETLPAYKGETLPPPVSVYGEPIVDPTR